MAKNPEIAEMDKMSKIDNMIPDHSFFVTGQTASAVLSQIPTLRKILENSLEPDRDPHEARWKVPARSTKRFGLEKTTYKQTYIHPLSFITIDSGLQRVF